MTGEPQAPRQINLKGCADGIERIPGFVVVGDGGFVVEKVRTRQTPDGVDIHICAVALRAEPEDAELVAELQQRIAAAVPLCVGAEVPFGEGRKVTCALIDVTVAMSGTRSLCADFADPMLFMARVEERRMYREQLASNLRLQPKVERHLDEGSAP